MSTCVLGGNSRNNFFTLSGRESSHSRSSAGVLTSTGFTAKGPLLLFGCNLSIDDRFGQQRLHDHVSAPVSDWDSGGAGSPSPVVGFEPGATHGNFASVELDVEVSGSCHVLTIVSKKSVMVISALAAKTLKSRRVVLLHKKVTLTLSGSFK
jgi:hypothetical protein